MAFTQEQRQEKLLSITTNKGYYDLYEEIFGEEVPVMMTLDGNEKTEIIINAIFDNEKIKGVKLEDDVNI
tara:strand:+ start:1021 stop:1230 length:210 start_codon:yes stop_codon:yes gene_type:complete